MNITVINTCADITSVGDFWGLIDQYNLGQYVVDESGISQIVESSNPERNGERIIISHQPIIITAKFENLQTGKELIQLTYVRNQKVASIIVPRMVISNRSDLIKLCDVGIRVHSINVNKMISFFQEFESLNDEKLHIIPSTSHLGWHNNIFIPYDKVMYIDTQDRFKSLIKALKPSGSYQEWLEHIKKIRAMNRLEIKVMMAAAFASPLVKILDALSFVVDLYGTTEQGKSVTLSI